MALHRYQTWNGPMPTASAQQQVATGTSIKTMLQLATPSTREIQLISWGFSLSGVPNGTVELLQTDVAATVTAHVASGVQPLDPNLPASMLTLGTSATGYTATAEGTPTATRVFDSQIMTGATGTNELNYSYQFMPDEQPTIAVSKFVRVRVTMGTGVNMQCYLVWAE
jgi:hypothetical protein